MYPLQAGDTPLHYGIRFLEIVKLLWDSGAMLDIKNKVRPIMLKLEEICKLAKTEHFLIIGSMDEVLISFMNMVDSTNKTLTLTHVCILSIFHFMILYIYVYVIY